jgi:hypothetical protein
MIDVPVTLPFGPSPKLASIVGLSANWATPDAVSGQR